MSRYHLNLNPAFDGDSAEKAQNPTAINIKDFQGIFMGLSHKTQHLLKSCARCCRWIRAVPDMYTDWENCFFPCGEGLEDYGG